MKVKILSILTILTFLANYMFSSDNSTQEKLVNDLSFEQYKQKYNKQYSGQEEIYREYVYRKNKMMIEAHNKKNKNFTMEINFFGDLSQIEFKESYLGIIGTNNPKNREKNSTDLQQNFKVEVEIDWVSLGKVTRVKDQKMCASCWAFCSIAALESSYMINQGFSELELSQQQLVDCSTPYGNKGCHGGQLWFTFKYLQDKGVTSETKYPYIGKDQNCKKTEGPYKMANYGWDVTCGGLYRALLKGPVAVAVDALNWGFYKEGIFDDCGNELTHGVLVVGATKDYWFVKNSWGASWGIQGFIKVRLGNTCSICEYPYFPIL